MKTCCACGHARESHSDATRFGIEVRASGPCLCLVGDGYSTARCPCQSYTERLDPSPPASVDDFDHGDDDGNPGL